MNDVTYLNSYIILSNKYRPSFTAVRIFLQIKNYIMKNKTLILTAPILLAVIMLFSCQISAKKAEIPEKNEVSFKDSIAHANTVNNPITTDSVQKFKIETEDIINGYAERITGLKEKIASEKTENKAKYEEKLALLEQKNKA